MPASCSVHRLSLQFAAVSRNGLQIEAVAPQIPHSSNSTRFHRATGTKNSVNCWYCFMRAHCVVLWHRGQVRVEPGPTCLRLLPKPKSRNITPA